MVFLKVLAFTVLVPGMGTVLIPYLLLRVDPSKGGMHHPLPSALGLLLILVGVSIYLRCAWDFAVFGRGTPAPIDPPRRLVVRGLYRHVRNPMYLGVLSVLIGEVWLFESAVLAWYMVAVAVGFHVFVVAYEEPTLRGMFGEAYENYCTAVGRWIPRRQTDGGESS